MSVDKEFISFKCLQVSQPIGNFYIGVIDSRDLVRIAFADVRKIAEEERDSQLKNLEQDFDKVGG